jgi:hypothetical protein
VVQSATEALSLLADHLTDIFPSADCSVFIQGAHALRDFLPTESLPDNSIVLEPLELGISLAACKVSVEKEGTKDGLFDVGNLDVNSVSVVLLSVLLEQVVSAVDDLQKQGAVNATKVINTLSELTDKCRAIKKELGVKELTFANENLTEALLPLEDLRGGLDGGKDWLNGVKEPQKADWKFLWKHAGTTIMKEAKVAGLRALIDEGRKVGQQSTWIWDRQN